MNALAWTAKQIRKGFPAWQATVKGPGRPQNLSEEDLYAWLTAHGPATGKELCDHFGVTKSVINNKIRQMGHRIVTTRRPDGIPIRSAR